VVELENNHYPGVANVAAGSVATAKGKKLVQMHFSAPAHPTWFTFKTINDWIGGTAGYLDSSLNTSQWDFDRYEPVQTDQRYSLGKCQHLSVSYNAAGGPIMVHSTWLALYGANYGTPATFTTPTRLTGQDYNTADVVSASFDLIRSFVWTAGRAQIPQPYANGTNYHTIITSHAIGGTLAMEQSPTASQGNQIAVAETTLTGTAVFQIGPTTTGVKFTNYVNRDDRRRVAPGNAPGTEFWSYSMADIANVGATGYPFQIVAGV
jgi:hypothetical protein